jgi:ABC-type phosphate transport system substrate-binding protein
VAAAAAACGGQNSDASITADGSSTVGPFMQVASECFQAQTDVEIDVAISESGDGLERS